MEKLQPNIIRSSQRLSEKIKGMGINDKKRGEGRDIRENNHGQTDGQTYIGNKNHHKLR